MTPLEAIEILNDRVDQTMSEVSTDWDLVDAAALAVIALYDLIETLEGIEG